MARRGFDVGYAPRHDRPAGLKHGVAGAGNRTLLIWAPGESVVHGSTHEVREVCAAIVDQLERTPGLVPVLVTDKADFAFYSRLGWLVEFLPTLSADAAAYREDKLRYLAWRYQGAVIVPAAAAFASPDDWRRIVAA